jgi:hypothetical protein
MELYRKRPTKIWYRVDMLLDLLESLESNLERSADRTEKGDAVEAMKARLRSISHLYVLKSGVDLTYGQVPANVSQLADYVLYCVVDGSHARLRSGVRVLGQLINGFREIRDESVRLEDMGEIPPIPMNAAIDTVA